MTSAVDRLEITSGPFLHRDLETPRLMVEVVVATLPVVAAATYFFGMTALLVTFASVAGALLMEWALWVRKPTLGTLRDGSALLTGILLALTLPPSIPLWMAFLGGAMGIGLGKVIWGGLGRNLFNPALVGRAFLQAAFPTVLTTWVKPGSDFFALQPSTLAPPLMRASVDVVTGATPLGLAKFENQVTELGPLLLGNTAGSLGETAGIVIIVCGLWLALRRIFDWRLAVSTLMSVAVFSGILHLVDGAAYPGPLFMLCSGGLLFGVVFMATDPVTTPLTPKGMWIFGLGVGLLIVLIRLFGGLPEGVMYSILLMNAVTPLIDRFVQPRQFGG